jgi:hypothetical protein
VVEAAGVELHNVFCLCNLQIPKDRQNPKIDDSQGHRTVIVQSMNEVMRGLPAARFSSASYCPAVDLFVHYQVDAYLLECNQTASEAGIVFRRAKWECEADGSAYRKAVSDSPDLGPGRCSRRRVVMFRLQISQI